MDGVIKLDAGLTGESYGFVRSFVERSGSRVVTVLCGDVSRGFCEELASAIREGGGVAEVHEVVKAEKRERAVGMVNRFLGSTLLSGLVAVLFLFKPLLWLTLRSIQTRVDEAVLSSIARSDAVVWVGVHEDFDVYFLVDRRLHKALRDKNLLLLGYPSEETARKLGTSYEGYRENYVNALNAPLDLLREVGERLRGQLARGTTARVVTPHGTDLTVQYRPEQLELFYGVIRGRDPGDGRLRLLLPAGEVGIFSGRTIVRASGKAFFDVPAVLNGLVVAGAEVTVKDGVVVDYRAERNEEALDRYFKRKDSRRVFEFSFGINPAIKPCGSTYLDEKAYRTVHLGFNRPFTPLHIDLVMSEPSVFIDGAELVW